MARTQTRQIKVPRLADDPRREGRIVVGSGQHGMHLAEMPAEGEG